MIAITGGGTGGHLSIAKAVCEEYNRRGIKPIYIGSTNGQDRKWFENYDGFSKRFFLSTNGVVNKKGFKKLSSLTNIIKHSLRCKQIFKQEGVSEVFSVGGYSAAPASIASIYTRKKLYIHEQNAISGRLNALLKPFAKEFFGSFANASKHLSYPVSERFFIRSKIREELKSIIFLGGSQGARFINNFALSLAPDLNDMGIKILHQCGDAEYEKIKKSYEKMGIKVDLFAFSKELDVKMSEADFAVSRSGASSLWELVASNLPALFIPYPYAAKDHQYFNAKDLYERKLCFLKRENELNEKEALKIIKSADIKSMSSGLRDCIDANGVKDIVDSIK